MLSTVSLCTLVEMWRVRMEMSRLYVQLLTRTTVVCCRSSTLLFQHKSHTLQHAHTQRRCYETSRRNRPRQQEEEPQRDHPLASVPSIRHAADVLPLMLSFNTRRNWYGTTDLFFRLLREGDFGDKRIWTEALCDAVLYAVIKTQPDRVLRVCEILQKRVIMTTPVMYNRILQLIVEAKETAKRTSTEQPTTQQHDASKVQQADVPMKYLALAETLLSGMSASNISPDAQSYYWLTRLHLQDNNHADSLETYNKLSMYIRTHGKTQTDSHTNDTHSTSSTSSSSPPSQLKPVQVQFLFNAFLSSRVLPGVLAVASDMEYLGLQVGKANLQRIQQLQQELRAEERPDTDDHTTTTTTTAHIDIADSPPAAKVHTSRLFHVTKKTSPWSIDELDAQRMTLETLLGPQLEQHQLLIDGNSSVSDFSALTQERLNQAELDMIEKLRYMYQHPPDIGALEYLWSDIQDQNATRPASSHPLLYNLCLTVACIPTTSPTLQHQQRQMGLVVQIYENMRESTIPLFLSPALLMLHSCAYLMFPLSRRAIDDDERRAISHPDTFSALRIAGLAKQLYDYILASGQSLPPTPLLFQLLLRAQVKHPHSGQDMLHHIQTNSMVQRKSLTAHSYLYLLYHLCEGKDLSKEDSLRRKRGFIYDIMRSLLAQYQPASPSQSPSAAAPTRLPAVSYHPLTLPVYLSAFYYVCIWLLNAGQLQHAFFYACNMYDRCAQIYGEAIVPLLLDIFVQHLIANPQTETKTQVQVENVLLRTLLVLLTQQQWTTTSPTASATTAPTTSAAATATITTTTSNTGGFATDAVTVAAPLYSSNALSVSSIHTLLSLLYARSVGQTISGSDSHEEDIRIRVKREPAVRDLALLLWSALQQHPMETGMFWLPVTAFAQFAFILSRYSESEHTLAAVFQHIDLICSRAAVLPPTQPNEAELHAQIIQEQEWYQYCCAQTGLTPYADTQASPNEHVNNTVTRVLTVLSQLPLNSHHTFHYTQLYSRLVRMILYGWSHQWPHPAVFHTVLDRIKESRLDLDSYALHVLLVTAIYLKQHEAVVWVYQYAIQSQQQYREFLDNEQPQLRSREGGNRGRRTATRLSQPSQPSVSSVVLAGAAADPLNPRFFGPAWSSPLAQDDLYLHMAMLFHSGLSSSSSSSKTAAKSSSLPASVCAVTALDALVSAFTSPSRYIPQYHVFALLRWSMFSHSPLGLITAVDALLRIRLNPDDVQQKDSSMFSHDDVLSYRMFDLVCSNIEQTGWVQVLHPISTSLTELIVLNKEPESVTQPLDQHEGYRAIIARWFLCVSRAGAAVTSTELFDELVQLQSNFSQFGPLGLTLTVMPLKALLLHGYEERAKQMIQTMYDDVCKHTAGAAAYIHKKVKDMTANKPIELLGTQWAAKRWTFPAPIQQTYTPILREKQQEAAQQELDDHWMEWLSQIQLLKSGSLQRKRIHNAKEGKSNEADGNTPSTLFCQSPPCSSFESAHHCYRDMFHTAAASPMKDALWAEGCALFRQLHDELVVKGKGGGSTIQPRVFETLVDGFINTLAFSFFKQRKAMLENGSSSVRAQPVSWEKQQQPRSSKQLRHSHYKDRPRKEQHAAATV